MRFEPKQPPRVYTAAPGIQISDCGSLDLAPNEQITLTTASGGEYDVARKAWGFYATPSLNARLVQFGLRGVLVQNVPSKRYYVLIVEKGQEGAFDEYLASQSMRVVHWLDSDDACAALDRKLGT